MKGILGRLGTILALFVSIVVIDFVWFSTVAGAWIASSIPYLREAPNLGLVYAGWLIVAFVFWYFVVQHKKAALVSLFEGALFGALIYSVHSLTNFAILDGYPGIFTLVDIIWGGIFFGGLALVFSLILRRRARKS